MKTFIAVALVCLMASALTSAFDFTEVANGKAKAHFQDCIKQENLSEEDVTRLRMKDFANPTPKMKCFGTCFFEKTGMLKDGIVQEDVVLEKLVPLYGEERVTSGLEKCKDIKGADRCDTGSKLFECGLKFHN